ncbi:MAG: dNTP triphosphohydrolase [Prevotellaceae bacterium]|nr:dNTP triphosphohydrolase [Prevotellaceae bacterium]
MMNWKTLLSDCRLGKEGEPRSQNELRTDFQRDYDRLIFSSAFRRMQNKTQVFPLPGSIFVHNRLTHSLEVSSVGRSLGHDVARRLSADPARRESLPPDFAESLAAIVSAAALAHDMGNPPFGHSGERAIRSFFTDGDGARYRGLVSEAEWADLTRFDGNANTFRLLTHQFEGRREGGFVMTYSTLAALVKYPWSASIAGEKSKFGFFEAERDTYRRIAAALGIEGGETEGGALRYVRHPLVYLVEAADDICYEIMDIEDAYKLRLLSADETFSLLLGFFTADEQQRLRDRYAKGTDEGDRVVYLRSCVVGALERAAVDIFVEHEQEILAGTLRGSLVDRLPEPLHSAYRRCAEIAVSRIYNCKEVLDIDLAGYHIIYTLLGLMTEAVMNPSKAYSRLLLGQASSQYQLRAPGIYDRLMAVVDYLSGMSDVFALDLYRKINGHSLPMV